MKIFELRKYLSGPTYTVKLPPDLVQRVSGDFVLESVGLHVQNFADMVAAKAVQQKRKAAERKEGKAKKTKESFKF